MVAGPVRARGTSANQAILSCIRPAQFGPQRRHGLHQQRGELDQGPVMRQVERLTWSCELASSLSFGSAGRPVRPVQR